MPGDVINSVALNEKLETTGKRKGMTVGGLGIGYPSNIAFGAVASAFEGQHDFGGKVVYPQEEIRTYAALAASGKSNSSRSIIKNAYYRSDMLVYMLTDEEDEKKNKKNKKKILHWNRGKKIDYASTQEQSWWTDEKNGVYFSFGTEDEKPWVWDHNLKRPVLYWQTTI
jgi:hypothetical protein